MFGWWKRNDGFEWRQYVRTTILIKREKRRQRLDELREAAVDKVKAAGERGVEAGAAGAGRVGSAVRDGARKAGRSLGSAASAAWVWLRDWLGKLLGRIGAAAPGSAGIRDRLTALRPAISAAQLHRILMVIAGLAAFWAVARYLSLGRDREVEIAAAIAALAVVGLVLTTLPSGHDAAGRAGAMLRRTLLAVPLPQALAGRGGVAALVLAAVAAAGAGGYWLASGRGGPGIASLVGAPFSGGEVLSGRAVAVSGDMLRIERRLVRLAGIEAPVRNQRCPIGQSSRRWDCGNAAARALAVLIRSQLVRCEIKGSDEAGRRNGVCTAGGKDIAAELVRGGHVFADSGWLAGYGALESEAKGRKAGVWRGEVVERPADFRAKRWEAARRTAPDGCPIKGQLTSDRRTYVLPWSPAYDRVKVRTAKGERWFCSEAEAQAAGWTPMEDS